MFPRMLQDNITKVAVALKDSLIKIYGQATYKKQVSSQYSSNYASGKMRICARLLMIIRTVSVKRQDVTMEEVIMAHNFSLIDISAILLCTPNTDDVEDIKSPSNGIKIKFDILNLITHKWKEEAERSGRDGHVLEEFFILERLMKNKWNVEVNSHCRNVLLTRSFYKSINDIPSTSDIKIHTLHIIDIIHKLNLHEVSEKKLRRVAQAVRFACRP